MSDMACPKCNSPTIAKDNRMKCTKCDWQETLVRTYHDLLEENELLRKHIKELQLAHKQQNITLYSFDD